MFIYIYLYIYIYTRGVLLISSTSAIYYSSRDTRIHPHPHPHPQPGNRSDITHIWMADIQNPRFNLFLNLQMCVIYGVLSPNNSGCFWYSVCVIQGNVWQWIWTRAPYHRVNAFSYHLSRDSSIQHRQRGSFWTNATNFEKMLCCLRTVLHKLSVTYVLFVIPSQSNRFTFQLICKVRSIVNISVVKPLHFCWTQIQSKAVLANI